jgi:hypothetical protein
MVFVVHKCRPYPVAVNIFRITSKPPVAPTGVAMPASDSWIWQSGPLRIEWQDWIGSSVHLVILSSAIAWV